MRYLVQETQGLANDPCSATRTDPVRPSLHHRDTLIHRLDTSTCFHLHPATLNQVLHYAYDFYRGTTAVETRAGFDKVRPSRFGDLTGGDDLVLR